MTLIVGLGNPGDKFAQTRHNIGFMVVDKLARELGSVNLAWKEDDKHKALIARVGDVILAKPLTFMNNVGLSVAGLVAYYKVSAPEVWVIHDDIDLPIGKIRIRHKGGSAGHHGVDSIMKELKSDQFIRFRLGVGRGMESTRQTMDKNWHHRSVISFVLSRFTQSEAGNLKHLIKNSTEAVRIALTEGIDKAMNRFN
ncbi:aminoacyl-tRNA hydrolase [Candidatus Gottesmanbacteria bacterium RIFCSPLOWO2_01_FULL_49_10]|uniref:Peptidyl-tRNA hydrolase n=1 Tax=Candidatus Gottesmanbacteria bacterium RIFCSPLOWO2_01_FULL_49_10 TaxID=1798396 RepID=A0A1F6AVZ8_9BACT|nr:MAG: aminoacyl-tRNA hydrolase [Candidatus Gottesmanbacteria bacterium RIFCSPLOWO2_01_FULL_49_10]